MQLIQTVLVIYTALLLNIRMSLGDEECWALVYKISTGGDGSAYELFMSDKTLNTNDTEAMALKCSKSQLKKHFKSDIVNRWETAGIDQVRISLYVSGIENAFLLFDGSGTTKTSWFKKSRLIDSSYTDLNNDNDVHYFCIEGFNGYNGDYFSRRFYIRKEEHGNCISSDNGWLLVGDKNGVCGYEKIQPKPPFILFSNPPHISKAKNHILADSMAIFVKLSIKATCLNPFNIKCIPENLPCITEQTSSSSTTTVSTSTDAEKSTMKSEDLQNKIDQIKMELTVQRKSTQKYRRSLTSAPDERTSSKLMGIIGGTFIISVIVFIVLLDCATCNMSRKSKAKKGNN